MGQNKILGAGGGAQGVRTRSSGQGEAHRGSEQDPWGTQGEAHRGSEQGPWGRGRHTGGQNQILGAGSSKLPRVVDR